MKNINFEDILAFIMFSMVIISIILLPVLIGKIVYKSFFVKDEVHCLGGHYEWRYNSALKQSMRTYICDSAKIIYK